jgi:hypothetical protein
MILKSLSFLVVVSALSTQPIHAQSVFKPFSYMNDSTGDCDSVEPASGGKKRCIINVRMAPKEVADPGAKPTSHASCYAIVTFKAVKAPKKTKKVIWKLSRFLGSSDKSLYRFEFPSIDLKQPTSFENPGFDDASNLKNFKWDLLDTTNPLVPGSEYDFKINRYTKDGDFIETCEPSDPTILNDN